MMALKAMRLRSMMARTTRKMQVPA
jgi:hypothetical protein